PVEEYIDKNKLPTPDEVIQFLKEQEYRLSPGCYHNISEQEVSLMTALRWMYDTPPGFLSDLPNYKLLGNMLNIPASHVACIEAGFEQREKPTAWMIHQGIRFIDMDSPAYAYGGCMASAVS